MEQIVKPEWLIKGARTRRIGYASVLALVMSGCTTVSDLDAKKVTQIDTRAQELLLTRISEESTRLQALQDDLIKQIEKVREVPAEPVEPVYNPLDLVEVSVRISNADARQVFEIIADAAKINLILPPELHEEPLKISVNMAKMPASQVLNQVLKMLDLAGGYENGMIVVRKHDERVFDLDFLQTATSAEFNAGGDVFGANVSSGVGQNAGSAGSSGIRSAFTVNGRNTNSTDPFDQIETLLRTVIRTGKEPGGTRTEQKTEVGVEFAPQGPRYMLNRATGTLYVKASPSQMDAVSRLVSHYRAVLGRQVLIEAQILDVELKDEFRYGLDWNFVRNRIAASYGSSGISFGKLTAGEMGPVSVTIPGAVNPGRDVQIPAGTVGGLGESLSAVYQGSRGIGALDVMKQFGTVHVLSNPSLRVKNTQPALVSVGTNERYVAEVTGNLTSGNGGLVASSTNVITGNLFDGVMLGVIPFISDDGTINLTINPMQSKVQPGSTTLQSVGGEKGEYKVSLPRVDFKGITTSLSLRNGDTVIIGGLIGEYGGRSKHGLPGVAEVPVLGEVIGGQARTAGSRELVIVLRVRVL
jgi:MSHA type pilus biogenesis protein MshL